MKQILSSIDKIPDLQGEFLLQIEGAVGNHLYHCNIEYINKSGLGAQILPGTQENFAM